MIKNLIKKAIGFKTIESSETKSQKEYIQELLKHYEMELKIINNSNTFLKSEKDKMEKLVAIYKAKLEEL